jgi:hypothetical protein
MGGEITVESTLGKDSNSEYILKLTLSIEIDFSPTAKIDLSQFHALVVDHNQVNRISMITSPSLLTLKYSKRQ